eukprot:gene4771-5351_t
MRRACAPAVLGRPPVVADTVLPAGASPSGHRPPLPQRRWADGRRASTPPTEQPLAEGPPRAGI